MAKKKPKNTKKQVTKSTVDSNINNDILAAAYGAATQSVIPVLLKVCRLCASKDGPFLNIFEADKLTAKRIDELMPFRVLENDHLPHKICFRCSAKLEELYEFVQKCIKIQENLNEAVGVKSGLIVTKSKNAKNIWEEKLNKSQMSNEDICDALIKKAMEGIQSIVSNNKSSSTEESISAPLAKTNTTPTLKTDATPIENAHTPAEENNKSLAKLSPLVTRRITRSRDSHALNKESTQQRTDGTGEPNLKQEKMSTDQEDVKLFFNKATRSSLLDQSLRNQTATTQTISPHELLEIPSSNNDDLKQKKTIQRRTNNSMSSLCLDYEMPVAIAVKETEKLTDTKEEVTKPFNIMDYISMIKVNGVGTLFQCQLCNRNFLKKEVVESHHCAKNGIPPKVDIPKSIPSPEPHKAPTTVKYIKMDGDIKKSMTERLKITDLSEIESLPILESIAIDEDSDEPPKVKAKPKVGPASKTGRSETSLLACSQNQTTPLQSPNTELPNTSSLPSVQFPAMPNLNSRFKLFPGPNNIFTLVEDSNTAEPPVINLSVSKPPIPTPIEAGKKSNRKRKSNNEIVNNTERSQEVIGPDKLDSSEVIDLEDTSQPYPVGLFQTVAHSESLYEPSVSKSPAIFTTPAMKKQSYTIVQTDNPSKLLISAKPIPVEQVVPKKRQRKNKLEIKDDIETKEPFTVTLEDVAPTKEPSFFTFINVDPLLQPSYVLPTDNIIQESQISTSSAIVNQNTQKKDSKEKDKYTCNMCGESFSREKKMLAHIQSHYTKMDEEDQMRVDRTTKKKGKK